jgi:hypothetical protein
MVLPYLLLVSFGVELNTFDQAKIELINNSPYQGVAVPLVSHYDTSDPRLLDFTEAVQRIKGSCRKQVWPWVFFNRFIGFKDVGNKYDPGDKEYFRKIKGMDLFNDAGALGDFYQLWRLSLKIAKEFGSPGIFVDPESYNDYSNYCLSYLAGQLGRSPEETENRLKAVGADLMRLALEEYPEAILWFNFTGMATPLSLSKPTGPKELMTTAFIVQGMLEQARKTGGKVKIVSGGGVSLGGCSESLANLKDKIEIRKKQYAPLLAAYPNLALGAPLVIWADSRQKKGWTLGGECGKSHLKDLNDFKPLISHLLGTYDYVWIYAGGDAGYEAYDPKVSAIYNKALGEIPLPKPRSP